MRLPIIQILCCLLLGTAGVLTAQDTQTAWQLASDGQYEAAEAQYKTLLAQDPRNLEALIGAGYNNSWHGNYKQAVTHFDAALALEPNNQRALFGKAYALAWAGRLTAGFAIFQRITRTDPKNVDARKGIGYVYLWQENGHMAQQYFRELATEYPDNPEFSIALAQAQLLEQQFKQARKTLNKGLSAHPDNNMLRLLHQNSRNIAAPLEIDVNGGYSEVNNEKVYGLRTVVVNGKIAPNTRAFGRFDNSLSLDLAALVRSQQDVRSFSGGFIHRWGQQMVTRADYGVRVFPNQIFQNTVGLEQVVLLKRGFSLKGGGFYAWGRNTASEWMTYVGGRIPVTRWYALEPYYFRSRTEKALLPERRFMLNQQFLFKGGYEFHAGGFYGQLSQPSELGDQYVKGGLVHLLIPVTRMFMVQGGVRYEITPFDQLVSATLGIRVRIDY